MVAIKDLKIIEDQPPVKIFGEHFDEIKKIKAYKGKFVTTEDGKLFAKLYPKSDWDNMEFFHDDLVGELGVKDAKSMDVKEVVVGGGKIEIELINDYVECRLCGKSTVYGDYNPENIDVAAIETEIKEIFDLDKTPILVVPDFEE